jgi:hypothetical protein
MVLGTEHRRHHTIHHAHVETTWGEAVTALVVLGILTFFFLH